MSEYRVIETQFTDEQLLVQALTEICVKLGGELEVSEANDLHLYGYHGKQRAETAKYVIRRRLIGSLANDLGFTVNADGSLGVIISEFDSGADEVGRGLHVLNMVKAEYNRLNVYQMAELQGYQVFQDIDAEGQVVLNLVSGW